MLGFRKNYQKSAEEIFIEHMDSMFGLTLERFNDFYRTKQIDALFRLDVEDVADTGGGCIASIILMVHLGPTGQAVCELMMGIGNSKDEAILYGVHDLVETVVPPILAMLTAKFDLPEVTQSRQFQFGETIWMAAQGKILSNDTTGALTGFLEQQPPLTLIENYLRAALTNESQFYWVKMYYAKMGDEAIGEVRVNNEVDEDASMYLQSLQFPQRPPLMFRQFSTFSPMEE
ncbi:MAG: DUF6348 family protein [Candidatus Obscuribacterales bacterium]|nr:DUF6348 family protein [Candidatus Obscuribacterales bacterium]